MVNHSITFATKYLGNR